MQTKCLTTKRFLLLALLVAVLLIGTFAASTPVSAQQLPLLIDDFNDAYRYLSQHLNLRNQWTDDDNTLLSDEVTQDGALKLTPVNLPDRYWYSVLSAQCLDATGKWNGLEFKIKANPASHSALRVGLVPMDSANCNQTDAAVLALVSDWAELTDAEFKTVKIPFGLGFKNLPLDRLHSVVFQDFGPSGDVFLDDIKLTYKKERCAA